VYEETQTGRPHNTLVKKFKPWGINRSDVVLLVTTVVDYFVERGSSLYKFTLDLSKASDSINYCDLYKSMSKAGIPIVNIVHCWYNILFVSVHWNNYFSECFHVSCGAGQPVVTLCFQLIHQFVNTWNDFVRCRHINCTFYAFYAPTT